MSDETSFRSLSLPAKRYLLRLMAYRSTYMWKQWRAYRDGDSALHDEVFANLAFIANFVVPMLRFNQGEVP